MPILFGVDIQKEIASAFKGMLFKGVLTKVTTSTSRGSNLSEGLVTTTKTYDFEGFIEDQEELYLNGTLIVQGGKYLSILGGSISVIPESGDKATIEGKTYEITGIAGRDPASAMYKCKVEV